MGKTKSTKRGGGKEAPKPEKVVKPLPAVKSGSVVKASQTPKAKSKEMAKKAAAVVEKGDKAKKNKKAKKEPTPPPAESSSEATESESEADTSSGGDSDSDVSMSSDDHKVAPKNGKQGVALPATNGHTVASDDTSESSASSSEDDDSEDDTEDGEPTKTGAAKIASKLASAPVRAVKEASSSSEEDDSSDADTESDEEAASALKQKLIANGAQLNGAAKKDVGKPTVMEEESDESDETSEIDSEEGSSSEESSEDEEEVKTEKPPISKKRGADAAGQAPAKKLKADAAAASDGASQTLHVKNLSWNVDEEWLSREFDGFGEQTGVRIITDKNTGRSRGYGYIDYASPADAAAALKAKNQAEIDGRTISVDFATPRGENNNNNNNNDRADASGRARNYGDVTSPESDTLFVANISFEANEDLLAEEFGQCGSILQVRLPTDPESGNMRGFGYVQFGSVDEAKKALETLNGTPICGRPIRLDFSGPRPSNTGGSPRGGRGGFGDRGGRGGRGGFGDRGGRGGFGDRGGRGGRGRGGFGDRGGRGGRGGGRGNSTNRGGFGDFRGQKKTFE